LRISWAEAVLAASTTLTKATVAIFGERGVHILFALRPVDGGI
jgi:hypothetical protein